MRDMMKSPFLQGFAFWLVVTVNLVLTFFMGYMLTALPLIGFTISGLLIIILSFLVNFTIVFYFKRSIEIPKDRRLFVVVLIYLNALFALAMGLSIPLMEDPSKDNLGFVMIPLLIILNIIIVDRFFFYLKIGKSIEETTDLNITSLKSQKRKWPIIEFEGKKYQFSIRSLLMLAIGAPLLAWLVYLFFDNQANFWLHEIVVKQTELFLNLFFNMGASVQYYPSGIYHWRFIIPGTPTPIYFETFCTGVQAICVFVGIIIFTPHSKDPKTKKDIVWRKTKSLIVSSILFYAVNIIRMLIQLDLYYNGYKWEDIHYSISAASSFIAAIIVLLLHKWIPEFIISFIYVGTLVSEPIKAKRIKTIKEQVRQSNRVSLKLLSKVMSMKRQTFIVKFPALMKDLGFKIENGHIIVPPDKTTEFLEGLDKKFKSDDETKTNLKEE